MGRKTNFVMNNKYGKLPFLFTLKVLLHFPFNLHNKDLNFESIQMTSYNKWARNANDLEIPKCKQTKNVIIQTNQNLYEIKKNQSPKCVLDWIKERDETNGMLESEKRLGQFIQY